MPAHPTVTTPELLMLVERLTLELADEPEEELYALLVTSEAG
ncbi:MAG: hypothetical protein ACRDHX_05925 [Chloroflexota bacterium]